MIIVGGGANVDIVKNPHSTLKNQAFWLLIKSELRLDNLLTSVFSVDNFLSLD